MNRIRSGLCEVPNPMNPKQVSRISLDPSDVDVIVFWTRNAAPLRQHLAELDERGYRYYFLYTLMDNPRVLDPGMAELQSRIDTFKELARRIGPEKVVWRYDPIIVSTLTPTQFHIETYEKIASLLAGSTVRSIVSVLDIYRRIEGRLAQLKLHGCEVIDAVQADLVEALPAMVASARRHGMSIQSCAEDLDLAPFGVDPGKCIDDKYLAEVFSIRTAMKKDASQRQACGCVESRDIGCYDTCIHGCAYCYATSNLNRAMSRHASHDPLNRSMGN